jgi:zinc transport system substrate-binding protein
VVASFAPLSEAVRNVGGDRVAVRDLTPPGVEPHDLEIAPDDMDRILDADLAVVLGGGFQPAVEEAVGRRDGPVLVVLDAPGVASDDGVGKVNGVGGDPHVWLDPTRMAKIVDAVAEALAEVDETGANVYRENADRYGRELRRLDAEIEVGLADCARRTVVTSHDAFGWLARRYDLKTIGVAGISPDAEPDPKRIADLADLAGREGVTTVFTETLVSPEIAQTLAREAGGLRTAVLNPFEGLTDDERAAGVSYTSVMRKNLAALRSGLDCR